MAKVRVVNNTHNQGWNVGDTVEMEGATLDKNLDSGAVEHVDAEDQDKYLKSQVEKKSPTPEAPKFVKDAFNKVTKKGK